MATKRKFSEGSDNDSDTANNQLKKRACPALVDRPVRKKKYPHLTQDRLRALINDCVHLYETLGRNDRSSKPEYSYTELIFLAIMRSPNFCLSITGIYEYVERKFSFFVNCPNTRWKNAVRHSLNKTKCFTKIDLADINPRLGTYRRSAFLWTINPKSLPSFIEGKYRIEKDTREKLRGSYKYNKLANLWGGCALAFADRIEAFISNLRNSDCPAKILQLQECNMDDIPEPSRTSSPASDSEGIQSEHSSSDDSEADPASPPYDIEAYCSLSPASSGYGSTCEIATREHNLLEEDIPEVSLSCLTSIPPIPEFPALAELLFEEQNELSLPSFVTDSDGTSDFTSSCQYESSLGSRIAFENSISPEEKSLLFEFLSF